MPFHDPHSGSTVPDTLPRRFQELEGQLVNVSTVASTVTSATISALQSSINNVSTRVDALSDPDPFLVALTTSTAAATTASARFVWTTHSTVQAPQVFSPTYPTTFFVYPETGLYSLDYFVRFDTPGSAGFVAVVGLIVTDSAGAQTGNLGENVIFLTTEVDGTVGGGVGQVNRHVRGTTATGVGGYYYLKVAGTTINVSNVGSRLVITKTGN